MYTTMYLFQMPWEADRKSKAEYLYSSVSRKITSNTQVTLKLKDFKDHESKTFMTLELSL